MLDLLLKCFFKALNFWECICVSFCLTYKSHKNTRRLLLRKNALSDPSHQHHPSLYICSFLRIEPKSQTGLLTVQLQSVYAKTFLHAKKLQILANFILEESDSKKRLSIRVFLKTEKIILFLNVVSGTTQIHSSPLSKIMQKFTVEVFENQSKCIICILF